MDLEQDERTYQTYLGMWEQIASTYPHGWFVALSDDHVVAAAESFLELEEELLAQSKDPRSTLVVEAGVAYPAHFTIFI